jgi:hypothetical protein
MDNQVYLALHEIALAIVNLTKVFGIVSFIFMVWFISFGIIKSNTSNVYINTSQIVDAINKLSNILKPKE